MRKLYRDRAAEAQATNTFNRFKGKPGRVIIAGTGPTIEACPRTAPDGWEIWGANGAYDYVECNRIFCVDADLETLERVAPKMLQDFYSIRDIPIVMQRKYPSIPMSQEFPASWIRYQFKVTYFTNTIACMIACALVEQVKEIKFYGVDIWSSGALQKEYQFERPCLEFWLGIAMGMGVEVSVPWVTMMSMPTFIPELSTDGKTQVETIIVEKSLQPSPPPPSI